MYGRSQIIVGGETPGHEIGLLGNPASSTAAWMTTSFPLPKLATLGFRGYAPNRGVSLFPKGKRYLIYDAYRLG